MHLKTINSSKTYSGLSPYLVDCLLGVDRERVPAAAPRTALEPFEEVRGRVVTYKKMQFVDSIR